MAEKYSDFWDESMETISQDEFHSLHQQKFLKQFKYVYENSDFYRDKYKQAGLELGDIGKLEDITKLPFTEKRELREAQLIQPPVGKHRACAISDVVRLYSSSGTTGIPTYLGLTQQDIETNVEVIARALWAAGFRPDSVVANIPTAPFIADLIGDAIEKIGSLHIPTGFHTDRVIAAFQFQGANALQSTVSYASFLVNEVQRRGIEPKELGLRTLFVGGEGGTGTVRARIEESFGASMCQGMGIGEISGAVWGECYQKKEGMHYLGQGLVHVEIIDPDTGEQLEIKDGTRGEIVYTGLERQCMPLLRYRSRDHIEVVSASKCDCGRTGFRINVLGRTDDMLTVLGVNVYPVAVKDVVSTMSPRVSGEIEIQLESPGPQVEPPMKIKIELGEQPGDLAQLKTDIERLLREKLVFRAAVELVESLPRYEYKGKLVRKLYEERPT